MLSKQSVFKDFCATALADNIYIYSLPLENKALETFCWLLLLNHNSMYVFAHYSANNEQIIAENYWIFVQEYPNMYSELPKTI